MAYTGRGTFFRLLQVYEREGISLVEVYKRVGKFVFPSANRPKSANRRIYGCEKKRFVLFCFLFHILKTPHLQELKERESVQKYVCASGIICQWTVYERGTDLFYQKWQIKG